MRYALKVEIQTGWEEREGEKEAFKQSSYTR